MANRWLILLSLTFARATMGFQFQSLVALGPLVVAKTGSDYAGLGVLAGIYRLPGDSRGGAEADGEVLEL